MKNENKIILGEKVYLRKMTEDDAPYIVEWRNDPDIKKWMFNQEEITIESHLNWFREKASNRIDYIICDKKTDKPIGSVSFSNIEDKKAEAGKMIGNKEYRGKGYAKEAYILWLNYGFSELGFEEIYGRTMANNIPNIKLNEKIGFRKKRYSSISVKNNIYEILTTVIRKEDLK